MTGRLCLLIRRWLPRPLRERAERLRDLQVATAGLQASEKRYRTLFENLDISIWNEDLSEIYQALERLHVDGVTDLRRYFTENPAKAWELAARVKVLHVNQATLRLFGATTEKQFLLRIDKTFSADSINVFIDALCAIWDKQPVFRAETTFRSLDGQSIDALISFQIPKAEDDFRSVPVSIIGITGRKQAERALQGARKMEAIGQLTGGIAHDFNNILGIIMGQVSLLQSRTAVPDEISYRLESIRKAAQRAANLTQQLLNFSRHQAHHESAQDINSVVDALDTMLARALTPEVKLDYRFAEDLWLTQIDRGDFEDALLNLLINARDAMGGAGRIVLATRNCVLDAAYCALNPGSVPGEYVQLAVTDTGTGMAKDIQERIFEPFFTTKSVGTGLGLAMVYGFTKRSGGYIEVVSESGMGTTMRLYLPRTKTPLHSPEQVFDESLPPPRGSETILAVDDEPQLLELAQESLQALGYRVLTADNGQQALERLRETAEVDLLFSDVVMPQGLSGYQLAQRATAQYPELKVLLTSGYSNNMPVTNGQARFSVNLLSKPYSLTELARQVRALLDAPNAADVAPASPLQAQAGQTTGLVAWTPELSVGVAAIDDDHRVLLELVNDSHRTLHAGESERLINPILDRLQAYTQTHFRREEAVMAAIAYPGLDNHAKVHQLLTHEVEKMRQQMGSGTLSAEDLIAFLGHWWVAHIGAMDRAFAPYCEGKAELIAQASAQAEPAPGQEDGP